MSPFTDEGPPGAGSRPRDSVRYSPVSGSSSGPSLPTRMLAVAAAPLRGSSLLFPRILDRGLEQAHRHCCPAVRSHDARWHFQRDLVVRINPARLTLRLHDRVSDGRRELRLASWFVDGADWTEVVTPVARLAEHRETMSLIAFRDRYREMPAFDEMVRCAREGRPAVRYGIRLDSEKRIHDYFRYFLRLIDSIERHGYRAQTDIGRDWSPAGTAVRGRYARRQREIGAAVDAKGRVLRFLGGRHRTAIAQALGAPAVPVEIRLIHADWLAAETARAGLPSADALRRWATRMSEGDPATG